MYSFEFITNQVQKNIQKYGQPVKITNGAGTSNVSTYGVFGKIEQKELTDQGSNVTIGTYILYVSYIKTAPEVGGTVTINKTEYSIVNVITYQPNNKAIAYRIEMVVA